MRTRVCDEMLAELVDRGTTKGVDTTGRVAQWWLGEVTGLIHAAGVSP